MTNVLDSASPFRDASGAPATGLELWPAYLVPRESIDAEVERLSSIAAPANGRRRSVIAHPLSSEPGLGLAPGIGVTLDVLLPGEHTDPIRHNSSCVNFCIEGTGHSQIDGRRINFEQYDAWVTPALATYSHRNTGPTRQVRLTYSNAPLLEKLNVHYVEDDPEPAVHPGLEGSEPDRGVTAIEMESDGSDERAYLLPYEALVNPQVVKQHAHHWPWHTVKRELDRLAALGPEYRGRRLYLLYNPASGRTQGTTNSFFATITVRPANIVDRPHRHASAAINYFFSGSGNSIVGGQTIEWKSGDLMLTAPGWAIHRHRSHDEPVYELTIQDSPLHLSMDSLLWQEDLRDPLRLLGSHPGFVTNRETAHPS